MKNFKIMLSVYMVIIIVLVSVVPTFATDTDSNDQAIISEDLAFVMENSKPDEKIKVYLWYKDIDQDEVDVLTTKATGLTPEKCAVIEEFPSSELLYSLRDGDAKAESKMDAYLRRTEPARKIERERTQTYSRKHMEISNEKYQQKSRNIIQSLSVSENNVEFSSQFAPLIIAEMTKDEIETATKNSNIEEINLYYEEITEDPLETPAEDSTEPTEHPMAKLSMGFENVYTVYGLTGDGVNVGLVENNIPGVVLLDKNTGATEALEIDLEDVTIVESVNSPITPDKYEATTDHSHSYNSLRVMAGNKSGIAKNINMYATNCQLVNIEEMLKHETVDGRTIDVINYNLSTLIYDRYHPAGKDPTSIGNVTADFAYHYLEKYMDYLVAHHNIAIVVAGGNQGSEKDDHFDDNEDTSTEETDYIGWRPGARITSPGMAYNVITVGGFDNETTIDKLGDFSWKNSYEGVYGCAKPDVVASAHYCGYGTSISSPILTAEIALMFELKPSLSLHPELVKAIVLASCHRKASQTDTQGGQETMSQGLTERQGAGIPDAWTMAGIVCQGTYGYGYFTAPEQYINFVQPKYGATGLNISVAWLRENTDTDPENVYNDASDITAGRETNVNLYVYQNDSLVKSSALSHSSTEMCYLDNLTTDYKYKIKLTQTYPPTKIRYGYAWSTNNMYAPISTNQDSINYIRSATSGTYIAYNTNSQTPSAKIYTVSSQSTFNDAYYWILEKTDNAYNISTGYGNTKLYLGQSSTQNDTSYESQLGTVAQNINILYNGDGTVSFLNSTNDKILTSQSDRTVAWNDFDNTTSTPVLKQKWYLDKVNYLCGDANMDGDLGTDDTNTSVGQDQLFIQNYIMNPTTLSNIQFYLTDVNKDGVIDIMDATMAGYLAINKYV